VTSPCSHIDLILDPVVVMWSIFAVSCNKNIKICPSQQVLSSSFMVAFAHLRVAVLHSHVIQERLIKLMSVRITLRGLGINEEEKCHRQYCIHPSTRTSDVDCLLCLRMKDT